MSRFLNQKQIVSILDASATDPKAYYKALDVSPTCSQNAIQHAYDKHIGKMDQASVKLEKVVEAYSVLSDPELRQQYDNLFSEEEWLNSTRGKIEDQLRFFYRGLNPYIGSSNRSAYDQYEDGLKNEWGIVHSTASLAALPPPGAAPSVRVIAVRHGRALHNETGGVWSVANRDAMLVPGVGEVQAAATGRRLEELGLFSPPLAHKLGIVVSPFRRTIQTSLALLGDKVSRFPTLITPLAAEHTWEMSGVQQADRGHTSRQLRIWWPISTHPHLDFTAVDAYCDDKDCADGKWWHHGPGRYETPGSFEARASELRQELFRYGFTIGSNRHGMAGFEKAAADDDNCRVGEVVCNAGSGVCDKNVIDLLCGDNTDTSSTTTSHCLKSPPAIIPSPPPSPSCIDTGSRLATVLLVSHGGILKATFGDEKRFGNGEFRDGSFYRVPGDIDSTWADVEGCTESDDAKAPAGVPSGSWTADDGCYSRGGRGRSPVEGKGKTQGGKRGSVSTVAAAALNKLKPYTNMSTTPVPGSGAAAMLSASAESCTSPVSTDAVSSSAGAGASVGVVGAVSNDALLRFHSVVQEVRDKMGNHHYHIRGTVNRRDFDGKYRLSELRDDFCGVLRQRLSKQCYDSLGEFPTKLCSRLIVMQWLLPWLQRVSIRTLMSLSDDSGHRTDALKIATTADEFFCAHPHVMSRQQTPPMPNDYGDVTLL